MRYGNQYGGFEIRKTEKKEKKDRHKERQKRNEETKNKIKTE